MAAVAAETPLPDSTPLSPADSAHSGASWPLSVVEDAHTPTERSSTAVSPPHSLVDSAPPSPPLGLDTNSLPPLNLDASDVETPVGPAAEADEDATAATPVSPTWSRSRLPVNEDEDGGASRGGSINIEAEEDAPLAPITSTPIEKGESKAGDKADEGAATGDNSVEKSPETSASPPQISDSASGDGAVETANTSPATDEAANAGDSAEVVPTAHEADAEKEEPATVRPALMLTRPTLGGANEAVSMTVPSTPSSSVCGVRDADEVDVPAKTGTPKQISSKQTGEEKERTALQIDTIILSDTERRGGFFVSPVPVSAVSPSSKSKTASFFETSFQIGPRSPPRVGHAFITELSDGEASIKNKFVAKPPLASTNEVRRAVHSQHVKETSSHSTTATRPLISPPSDGSYHSHSRSRLAKPSHRSRSRSASREHRYRDERPRPTRRFVDDTHDDTDEDELYARPSFSSSRLPFVQSRTVVSAQIPKLREAVPTRTEHSAFQHAPRAPPAPSHRQQRPPVEDKKPRSLSALIDEIKLALRSDTSAYYALRGVLAEFDERNSGAAPRGSSKPGRIEREPEQPRPQPAHRRIEPNTSADDYPRPHRSVVSARPDKRFPLPASRARDPRRVKPAFVERRAPVHRFSLTQTSDEDSMTEVEVVKPVPVKKKDGVKLYRPDPKPDFKLASQAKLPPSHSIAPAAEPRDEILYKYKQPALQKLVDPVVLEAALAQPARRRDSPSPPEYPSHLSPRYEKVRPLPLPASSHPHGHSHSHKTPLVHPVPIRPVPIRPVPDLAPSSETRFPSPPRGKTLTIKQAVRLADGLGLDAQVDKLRRSGLRGEDKVSKLEGKKDDKAPIAAAEGVKHKSDTAGKKHEKLRRRHSFDSVVDFKTDRTGRLEAKPEKEEKGSRALVKIPVDLGLVLSPAVGSGKNKSPSAAASSAADAKKPVVPAGADAPAMRRLKLETELAPAAVDDKVYRSPTVGSAGVKGASHFGAVRGVREGRKEKEKKRESGKGKAARGEKREGEKARKRAREGSYPPATVGKPAAAGRGDSISFDFDDFF